MSPTSCQEQDRHPLNRHLQKSDERSPHPFASMFIKVSFLLPLPLRQMEMASVGGSCPTVLKYEKGAIFTVPSGACVDVNAIGLGTTGIRFSTASSSGARCGRGSTAELVILKLMGFCPSPEFISVCDADIFIVKSG